MENQKIFKNTILTQATSTKSLQRKMNYPLSLHKQEILPKRI